MVIELQEEHAQRYKMLYIQYQLALTGGYMSREEATQVIVEFTDFTTWLLLEYDVDLQEDWGIEIHSGVVYF